MNQHAIDGQLTLEDVQQIIERSERNEEAVELNILKELDADMAHAVAKTRGKLFLNGLTAITPEVAGILATHHGWLHLEGLRSKARQSAGPCQSTKDGFFLTAYKC